MMYLLNNDRRDLNIYNLVAQSCPEDNYEHFKKDLSKIDQELSAEHSVTGFVK